MQPKNNFILRSASKKHNTHLMVSVSCFVLFGFLIAFTQVLGESPDYLSYDIFFNLVRQEGLNVLTATRFEPAFSIASIFLSKLFASNVVVYSWFVAAALLLKGRAIYTYSRSAKVFLIVAIMYFVRYFPLHELTQLRTACAIALILMGATLLWEGRLGYGLLACAAASVFQMSAIIIIPALFLTASNRLKIIIITISAFILILTYSSLITQYLAGYILILDSYQNYGFSNVKANPFAIHLLIDWSVIAISFFVWNRLTQLMKRIVFIQLIGMAIFYGGIELGVVAHRVRELYSVLWVFFVADGLRLNATKALSYGFVLVCIVFYSYIFFAYEKFFN